MPKPTTTVIIPAFNECDFIDIQIAKVRKVLPSAEIIVIDDGSDDDTAEKSKVAGGMVRVHPCNRGNGAAIKNGIRSAHGEILISMDADGQHDPDDIPKLLEYLDRYDLVVGSRTGRQQASSSRQFMNSIFNRLASYVTGYPVKDLTSGFRAVRADLARDLLPLLPNGYSWPTTSTLVLLRSGFSIKYVPVNVRPRQQGRSRIRPVRDSLRFFMIMMKICTLYSPFRIFLPVSGTMFLLGLSNYAYTFFTQGRFTNMSALMFSSAVIIFMMGLVSEQISQIGMLRHQFRNKTVRAASAGEAGNSEEQRN